MASVIDDYIAALRRELDFDPALARRLASEVEDHLRDAAEADPAWPSPDAERRAVERFGLSREIAAQFAADAIDRQARRTWVTLAVTVAVTFVAMRLRVMWLDDGAVSAPLALMAPLIDRYAFIAALCVGVVSWFAFRRSLAAQSICLAGLIASIAAGIVRADLFSQGAPLHVVLAAAGEIALIGLLSFHVVGLGRRLKRTAGLRRAGS
jgi:HAAS